MPNETWLGTWPHPADPRAPLTGGDPKLANELANIITAFFGGYAPLPVRYGIASAILRAGYTKET